MTRNMAAASVGNSDGTFHSMSQIHKGSTSSHRLRRRNGALPRRDLYPRDHEQQPPSKENNHRERPPRPYTDASMNDFQFFEFSPISIGDIKSDRNRYIRPHDSFAPLPFDGTNDNSSDVGVASKPHNYHDKRGKKTSASDCSSICSDQAVIASPTTKTDTNDEDIPTSCQSEAILEEPHIIEEPIACFEEPDEDSFDPNVMPVPPTELWCNKSRHHFHRLSRTISLPNYRLGQKGKLIDMRVESALTSAQFAVASLLREFDAAFIRRSDGNWTYAILAEKILTKNVEDSKLRFVVKESGSTKNLSYYKWGECVRLVREPVEANALLHRRVRNVNKSEYLPEAMPVKGTSC